MKKAVGYIRVSSDMQAEKGTSLDNQRERITEFARKKGYEIVHLYEDAGFSGKTTNRPAFQEMFKILRAGGIQALFVWHSTRFARNVRDFINYTSELEKLKINFYSVEEPAVSGSSGKAMRNLMAVFAEYQSDVTGEYTRSVKSNLKKNKRVYCAYPPLGFKNQEGRLVVDPVQMEVVHRIRSMKEEGMSNHAIAYKLNLQGVRGAKGGRFHSITIQKILTNNIYAQEANKET